METAHEMIPETVPCDYMVDAYDAHVEELGNILWRLSIITLCDDYCPKELREFIQKLWDSITLTEDRYNELIYEWREKILHGKK